MDVNDLTARGALYDTYDTRASEMQRQPELATELIEIPGDLVAEGLSFVGSEMLRCWQPLKNLVWRLCSFKAAYRRF